jgi:hypothetical protein
MRVSCGGGCRERDGEGGAGGGVVVSIGSGDDEVEVPGTPAARGKVDARESVNERERILRKRDREKVGKCMVEAYL